MERSNEDRIRQMADDGVISARQAELLQASIEASGQSRGERSVAGPRRQAGLVT